MEFYFEHNNEKIINLNDLVRHEVRNHYEETLLSTREYTMVIEKFKNMFLRMYEEEPQSYHLYAQVMLTDAYKMLVHLSKQNIINEEDLMTLNTINYFKLNSSELYHHVSTSSGVFEDTIKYTVLFDKLNILGRKVVVQNNKDYYANLNEISPLSMLDILKYGKTATPVDFINYYNETLDLIVTDPETIVNDIKYHMRHLYLFDRESYKKNLKKMAQVFYKWIKFQKNINEIENKE